jgi:FKBP-type peptidyl-prolyl cis-trans isomerase
VTIGKIGYKGWDQALTGACQGETRRAFVPYELGYGEQGAGDKIPSNSNLILDIEILNVRSRVLNFLDRISSGSFNGGK